MTAVVPATIRNNNPGGMYPGKVSQLFGSSTFEWLVSKDGEHKIATFADPVQGGAALIYLLRKNYTGLTMKAAITKWCGAIHVDSYMKVLKAECGIEPDETLSAEALADPVRAIALAKAMAKQEAGRAFPMSDEQWKLAHAFAMKPVAPAFSPDNNVPSPKLALRVEPVKGALQGLTVGGVVASVDPAAVTSTISAWKGLGVATQEAVTWAAGFGRLAIGIGVGVGVFALVRRFSNRE